MEVNAKYDHGYSDVRAKKLTASGRSLEAQIHEATTGSGKSSLNPVWIN